MLDAFDTAGHTVTLDGGDETTVVVGDRSVLKKVMNPALSAWSQQALSRVAPAGFRVPTPIAATDGRWVVDGWTATEFVPYLRAGTADRFVWRETELALTEEAGEHR